MNVNLDRERLARIGDRIILYVILALLFGILFGCALGRGCAPTPPPAVRSTISTADRLGQVDSALQFMRDEMSAMREVMESLEAYVPATATESVDATEGVTP